MDIRITEGVKHIEILGIEPSDYADVPMSELLAEIGRDLFKNTSMDLRAKEVWLKSWEEDHPVTNKVAAIKFVRGETGWGLKEAKDWVETRIDNEWSKFIRKGRPSVSASEAPFS